MRVTITWNRKTTLQIQVEGLGWHLEAMLTWLWMRSEGVMPRCLSLVAGRMWHHLFYGKGPEKDGRGQQHTRHVGCLSCARQALHAKS